MLHHLETFNHQVPLLNSTHGWIINHSHFPPADLPSILTVIWELADFVRMRLIALMSKEALQRRKWDMYNEQILINNMTPMPVWEWYEVAKQSASVLKDSSVAKQGERDALTSTFQWGPTFWFWFFFFFQNICSMFIDAGRSFVLSSK